MAGRISLPDVEGRLTLGLTDDEREEEDTVGGHVTARLGRLPRPGDSVVVGRYVVTVIDASRRRVQRLRLRPADPEGAENLPGDAKASS